MIPPNLDEVDRFQADETVSPVSKWGLSTHLVHDDPTEGTWRVTIGTAAMTLSRVRRSSATRPGRDVSTVRSRSTCTPDCLTLI